jgi:ribonuclease HIII
MKIAALKRFVSAVMSLALMGSATAFAQQSNKPNVVFILADNVGYGDMFGSMWIARSTSAKAKSLSRCKATP